MLTRNLFPFAFTPPRSAVVLFVLTSIGCVGAFAGEVNETSFCATYEGSISDPNYPGANSFGTGLCMIEGHLLIGSRWEDDGAADSGGVYQYSFPSLEPVRKIQNPAPSQGEQFGSSIASDGSLVFIAAGLDNDMASDGGAVHVYDLSSGTKVLTLYSPAPQVNGHFGNFVTVSGDSLFIAARGENIPIPGEVGTTARAGKVYQYQIGTWNLIRTYENPDPQNEDYFGQHIFAHGPHLAVGAHLDDKAGRDAGEAYVYDTLNGDLLHTIVTPSPVPVGSRFGITVALSDQYLAVGAPDDDQLGERTGAVYLYDVFTGGYIRTLFDPNPQVGQQFAGARFMGDLLLVAAAASGSSNRYGEVHLFDPDNGDFLYSFINPNRAIGDYFGSALSSVDNTVAISAWGQNNDSGVVYFYDLQPGECVAPTPTTTPVPTTTPSPTPEPGTSIVAGYVISSSDFSPIAEAALSLDGMVAFPNVEGLFVFHNIHSGTLELQAVSPGFEPYSRFRQFGPSNAILVELNPRGTNPNADFNFDGMVDGNDLLEISKNWKNEFPGHTLDQGEEEARLETLDLLHDRLRELLEGVR